MEEPSELGASKEKPIELNEDDESSDGENSVIILDSDTEPEDGAGGEEDEDNGEDSEEEDEEDSDEEESEDDSDSSVDTESVNSVWSNVDEENGEEITTEAAEAKIIKKFEKAIFSIADNDSETGRRILEKLLNDAIIATYNQENPDFELLDEPPRLAKMLQVFIASHRNLAKLCEKEVENADEKEKEQLKSEEIQHLCQVLAYEPNSSDIWLDVALKSIEFGDLNFSKYAFKRCETLKESLESHATLLYLTCDYNESLMIMKQFQEQNDVLNDKLKYLKHKIRSTNQYYKLSCDRIFEEDEVYADVQSVEKRKIQDFDERIEALRSRVVGKIEQRDVDFRDEEEKCSVIPIRIEADQDLQTVCTIFCDLFDRIHAYSHCRHQLIEFTEWESRRDHLDVLDTVEHLVDVVECVEDISQKVEELENLKRGAKGRRKKQQQKDEKKEYLASWRKRLFVEKNSEEPPIVITIDSEACTTADEDDEENTSQIEEILGMPENELAQEFELVFSELKSIRSGGKRRERTPPPSKPHEFIDCDMILQLLETIFSGESRSILEILEHTLFLISDHTPAHGALPENMREVTREMYARLALFDEISDKKFEKLNVMLVELDSKKAMQVAVIKYISPFSGGNSVENGEETRDGILRFMWKYAQTGLKDEIKLEYLETLLSLMHHDESIATSYGSFATWDVELSIDDLQKKKRIDSVKQLWKSNNYANLVDIIQNDIDFAVISVEEAIEMWSFWVHSLEKLKLHVELIELVARLMHFYLFSEEASTQNPEKIERNVDVLLLKFQKIRGKELRKAPISIISTIGYLTCIAFKKYSKFEKDWKNWRVLYEIVKIHRGDAKKYIEQLDKAEDPDTMPLMELDLLVKAHDVLGEHQCCAQKNYEFLFFMIDRFRLLIDDIPLLEMCYLKDNGYLWNNVNQELSQVLFCMYGKYGRKRRAREDHENGGKCVATPDVSRRIMAVILVQPLPLYDEKEKLAHDISELLNSKFPFLLEISAEKKKKRLEFKEFLQKSSSLEDVNSSLQQCRDDVDDYIQSLVWYTMALISFRQNSFKDAAKYAELYLLTEESAVDARLRGSVWGMLAHASVHNLFQFDPHEIYEQWKWRIMPFRMAVDAQQNEPVPHFELAAILYQLASSLARFYRTLPKDDARRKDFGDVQKLRVESRQQFDRSLELTKIGEDGSQPEHQWLCYFFIGKLEAKSSQWDILKVVESFYEAACGCELAGFYYPQKVQTKKQTNFEPLEVHYQAFSAVYKYLINNELPSLKILRKLHVLLKILDDGHKVVRQSNSLFKVNVEVYSVMDELVMSTLEREKDEEENSVKFDTELREQLVTELKEMCTRAFTLVTDRFPHIKSFYRLAQLHFEKGEFDEASEHIFKNTFKRKKRDDGMFDNCVEISCNDINRNGSFGFHIERCAKLGAQVAQKTMDLYNVVAMLNTMINIIAKDDDEHIDASVRKTLVNIYLTALEHIVQSRNDVSTRSTPSPAPGEATAKQHHIKQYRVKSSTLRSDLWRLWQTLSKCSKPDEPLIRQIKTKAEVCIVHCFKSIDELRARMLSSSSSTAANSGDGKRRNNTTKRKFDALEVVQQMQKSISVAQSSSTPPPSLTLYDVWTKQLAKDLLKNGTPGSTTTAPTVQAPAPSSSIPNTSTSIPKAPSAPVLSAAPPKIVAPAAPAAPTHYSPISSDDDEIQCIEPPPAKKPAPSASAHNLSALGHQKPGPTAPKVTAPKPTTSTASSQAASTMAALLASSGPDNVSKFILANANSADSQKQRLALQLLAHAQASAPAAPTASSTNQIAAQLIQALQAAKDAQTAKLVAQEKAKKEAQEKARREAEAKKEAQLAQLMKIAEERSKKEAAEKKAKEAQRLAAAKLAQQANDQAQMIQWLNAAHYASPSTSNAATLSANLAALASLAGNSGAQRAVAAPLPKPVTRSPQVQKPIKPTASRSFTSNSPSTSSSALARPSTSTPSHLNHNIARPQAQRPQQQAHLVQRPQAHRLSAPAMQQRPQAAAARQPETPQPSAVQATLMHFLNSINDPVQREALSKQLFRNK